MKKLLVVAWGLTMITAGSAGFVVGDRNARRAPDTLSVATVNGERVSQAEFEKALQLVSGQEVLRLLCAQKAVIQEAKKRGVSVSDAEVEHARKTGTGLTFGKGTSREDLAQNPSLQGVVDQEVQAGLLVRKMILADMSETWKRHLYDLFKDELAQYELFCIVVPQRGEAEVVQLKLNQGESFEELASSYSVDEVSKQNKGRIGVVTLPAVESLLGSDASEAVRALKPGAVSSPIQTPFGYVLLKVGSLRAGYEDLRPAIEELFIESRRLSFLQQVLDDSKLVSPYGAKIQIPAPLRLEAPNDVKH